MARRSGGSVRIGRVRLQRFPTVRVVAAAKPRPAFSGRKKSHVPVFGVAGADGRGVTIRSNVDRALACRVL